MTPGWDWTRYAVAGARRPDSFTGMRPEFSDALAAMFSAAPADIRDELRVSSGYRSPERQAEIYRDALAKYGSEAEARQWAAPPGKSNHNRGVAADLSFLSPAARAWVHDNAQTYGLAFPLRNEPWHVELAGVRDEPLAYLGDEKPVSGAHAAITQALALRGNPTTNEGPMIDMSKWRSNDLANALLARSMQTQASSPVEAFSQIAQALMARKATERNDASNNSLLAQALMGSDLPESSRAAVMTSGNPNTLAQALLQNEQAKAAAAQHQADMAWKMDERQYQRGRDAMSDQRYAAEHAPYRTISAEEAGQMGLPAGQGYQVGPDGKVGVVPAPKNDGMIVESDGQGGFRAVQGPTAGVGKPLTEGQSKETAFTTLMIGANDILTKKATALMDRGDRALGSVPFGWGRGYQDTDYQLAEQAGNDFLTALLRKDTGAVISADDTALYGPIYLPTPGDTKELLDQKAASRMRAIEAIRASMPATAIAAQEMALRNTAAAHPPATQDDVPTEDLLKQYGN